MRFSPQVLKQRALYRVAFILYQQWEEFGGGDTRLFDWLINDSFVEIGRSKKGDEYREHVVPRVIIRDLCINEFKKGKKAEDVVVLINELLMIVRISNEEARHLNHELQLKTKMPRGWIYGEGNNMARLLEARIELA